MIALIWKYNSDNTYLKSRQGETLEEFKKRVLDVYPYEEGYHIEVIKYEVIR